MNEKQYQLLLAQAPDQDSDLFIDFLRANNTVVQEDKNWIVIENCKYHTKKIPWYTAFDKGGRFSVPYMDFITLNYRGWEWIKKETSRQTVPKRFHIHLTRKK